MKQKITLLDGALGTLLIARAAAGGLKTAPVWSYSITAPEIVGVVALDYAIAGSEIICANTFGANRFTVEKESSYSVEEVVFASIGAAKSALAGTGARIALDIGPLPVLMEPYGSLSEEDAERIFSEVTLAGEKAGADCIFLETFLDAQMLAVAAQAAKKTGLPLFCSLSFEKNGRTFLGNSVEESLEYIEAFSPEAVGMNCSLGPELAVPVIREFAEKTDLPLFFKPNAGMPKYAQDGKAYYDLPAQEFARQIAPALESGRIGYLGGCCGTDPEFIRALASLIGRKEREAL